jgi:hypothetical protein
MTTNPPSPKRPKRFGIGGFVVNHDMQPIIAVTLSVHILTSYRCYFYSKWWDSLRVTDATSLFL